MENVNFQNSINQNTKSIEKLLEQSKRSFIEISKLLNNHIAINNSTQPKFPEIEATLKSLEQLKREISEANYSNIQKIVNNSGQIQTLKKIKNHSSKILTKINICNDTLPMINKKIKKIDKIFKSFASKNCSKISQFKYKKDQTKDKTPSLNIPKISLPAWGFSNQDFDMFGDKIDLFEEGNNDFVNCNYQTKNQQKTKFFKRPKFH